MEKKIKIKGKRKNTIFWLVGLILILALLFFLGDYLRSIFLQKTSNLQYNFSSLGKNFFNFWQNIFFDEKLREENKKLKEENQKMIAQLVELENLKKENEELKKALNLHLEKDFILKEANIISISLKGHAFYINKGKEDGVEKDLPVINSNKVLIGKIKEVYQKNSLVELITAPDQKIGVLIGPKKIPALAKGEGKDFLVAENIPKGNEIETNQIVISANIQKEIPSSLLIGEVKQIEESDLAPFLKIKIKPFFDLSQIDLVFIILDF